MGLSACAGMPVPFRMSHRTVRGVEFGRLLLINPPENAMGRSPLLAAEFHTDARHRNSARAVALPNGKFVVAWAPGGEGDMLADDTKHLLLAWLVQGLADGMPAPKRRRDGLYEAYATEPVCAARWRAFALHALGLARRRSGRPLRLGRTACRAAMAAAVEEMARVCVLTMSW